MNALRTAADHLTAAGLVSGFAPDAAPEGFTSETGRLAAPAGVPVTLIDDGSGDALDPAEIAASLAAAEARLRAGAEAIAGRGAADDWAGWAPEFAFFPGGEWSIRFAEVPNAGPYGVLVAFLGAEITAVQDLAEGVDAE